jgi:glycosyltransferase 2 family protein
VMLGASLLLLTMLTVTGIVVGAVILPWSSPDGLHRYWWLLVLLPPLVAVLHPRVVGALIDRFSLWMGGERLEERVSVGGVLRAAAWAVLAWVVLGAHLLILMTAYGRVDALDVAAAVGGIGLAWAAGLACVPVPAGAGVREGVLVLTLGSVVGRDAALTVALASRVLLVVADVALAAAALGMRSLRGVRDARAARSAPDMAGSASAPGTPARRDQNA